MMKLRSCFAALLLACAATAASAVPVRGLYEARVPVPDQGPAAREQALQQALRVVLVRVTGSRTLAGAEPLLGRASSLVQGYGYEAAPGAGFALKAQFDARAINAELKQQGLPVWGPIRLRHQVWLALRDDGGPRALLDAAAAAARAPALVATAEERGLPLSFPNLDATDQALATFAEVWSGATDGVRGAARRYEAERILIGRVGRDGGRWQARWTLLDGAALSEEWVTTGSALDVVLGEGIHELADREGRRFAIQPGTGRELRVQVAGVTSLQDYARALNYLRGLNAVRAAQVEATQDDVVTIRLSVEGEAEALGRAIASGGVLRRDDAGLFGPANRYVLIRSRN